MADLPLVSIITPSYNQADFLEQTIQSVLGQNYPNIEYMVVDGDSNDSSVEIIKKYADQLTWWISEPDGGQAEAINKGFRRAKGEIVGWLNSDDLYLPGAISAAVKAFEENPECVMVFGDCRAIDQDSRVTNLIRYHSWTLDDLMCFNIIGQPAVFMRRWALARAGYLNTDLHYMLDTQLWLRIGQLGKMLYIPQAWAAARFHPSAKNVAHAPGFGREAYDVVTWMQWQPGLKDRYDRLKRRIMAGAHRINGRYLLEGGLPWESLKAFTRSFFSYPPIALKEWKRILYALFSLVGLEKLGPLYLKLRLNARQNSEKS
jgi:glycosyltransferase involved in cell wall biosynthesis